MAVKNRVRPGGLGGDILPVLFAAGFGANEHCGEGRKVELGGILNQREVVVSAGGGERFRSIFGRVRAKGG